MPIKPENRARYPKNWKEIRVRILARAGHKCEKCGVKNHDWGWRDAVGKFHRVSKGPIRNTWPREERYRRKPPFVLGAQGGPLRIIEIVLTIAHLDHTPENCTDDNLRAWCQKCHLAYDAEHHKVNAAATRRAKLAIGDLLEAAGV